VIKKYIIACVICWALSLGMAHTSYGFYPIAYGHYIEPMVIYNLIMYTMFIGGFFCMIRIGARACQSDGVKIE
jgi:hypothetical protein